MTFIRQAKMASAAHRQIIGGGDDQQKSVAAVPTSCLDSDAESFPFTNKISLIIYMTWTSEYNRL